MKMYMVVAFYLILMFVGCGGRPATVEDLVGQRKIGQEFEILGSTRDVGFMDSSYGFILEFKSTEELSSFLMENGFIEATVVSSSKDKSAFLERVLRYCKSDKKLEKIIVKSGVDVVPMNKVQLFQQSLDTNGKRIDGVSHGEIFIFYAR